MEKGCNFSISEVTTLWRFANMPIIITFITKGAINRLMQYSVGNEVHAHSTNPENGMGHKQDNRKYN